MSTTGQPDTLYALPDWIQVGATVYDDSRYRPFTVDRLTSTQIVVRDRYGAEVRFRRRDLRAVGGWESLVDPSSPRLLDELAVRDVLGAASEVETLRSEQTRNRRSDRIRTTAEALALLDQMIGKLAEARATILRRQPVPTPEEF